MSPDFDAALGGPWVSLHEDVHIWVVEIKGLCKYQGIGVRSGPWARVATAVSSCLVPWVSQMVVLLSTKRGLRTLS